MRNFLASDEVPGARFGKPSHYAKVLRGAISDEHDFSYSRSWNPKLLTSSMRTEHTPLSQERFTSTLHGKVETVSRFLSLTRGGSATPFAQVRVATAEHSPHRDRFIQSPQGA